ncbi:MAG: hypothetical protein ACK5RF_16925, partial [Pirellula sp.]
PIHSRTPVATSARDSEDQVSSAVKSMNEVENRASPANVSSQGKRRKVYCITRMESQSAFRIF